MRNEENGICICSLVKEQVHNRKDGVWGGEPQNNCRPQDDTTITHYSLLIAHLK
jgi:hypothetical protein